MADNITIERKDKTELESGYITVQRRNMRRGKPQQQLYRPGSGPLRKSNSGIEESESDTNLVINSRQNQSKHFMPHDDSRYKSEGSSPRDRVADIDRVTSKLGDISVGSDTHRRQKKPEQVLYVPKPIAKAREMTQPQDYERDAYSNANGNDKNYDSNERFGNKSKRYSNKRRGNDNHDYQDEWREKSPSVQRHVRQGSEPRGASNGPSWQRSRDTRSVEPSNITTRSYNSDKLPNKPPSGRRHSTIGLEDKRFKSVNIDNLPPRFRKKLLEENKLNNQTIEESWDGSSLTFQGSTNTNNFSKNSNYHHMGNYATLPGGQNVHHQNGPQSNQVYFTLPNRPRGRGRLQHDHYSMPPGDTYRSLTPDKGRSPSNSRPHTPPFVEKPKQENSPSRTATNYNRIEENKNYNEARSTNDRFNKFKDDRYRRNVYDRDKRSSEERHPLRHTEDRRPRQENRREYNSGRGYESRKENECYRNDNYKEYSRREIDRRDRVNQRQANRRDHNINVGRGEVLSPDTRNINENGGTPARSGFRKSLEDQLSPVSPVSPEELPAPAPVVCNTSLDWSEEVELNDRLEAEALSDALTRSSSLASLVEISTKSAPITTTPTSVKKSKKRNRRKSSQRSDSSNRDNSRSRSGRNRQNSCNSIESKDNFKVPPEPKTGRRRRNSRDRRETSFDRFHNKSKNPSRECSFDRNRRSSTSEHENWREEIIRSRQNSEHEGHISRKSSDRSRNNSERDDSKSIDMKKAGILVLPQHQEAPQEQAPLKPTDQPKYPEVRKLPSQQKSLYDPSNPNKPIIIKSPGARVSVPGFSDNYQSSPPQMYTTDQFGNIRPGWYDENSEAFGSSHYPQLIADIRKADTELQFIINSGHLLVHWGTVENLRMFLKEALIYMLCKDLKFCQTENVEQHLWKILYYNIIEVTRKAINADAENKEHYKGFLVYLIDEGCKYFEDILQLLEETYNFKLNDFLGSNSLVHHKGLGYVGLALIAAQKVYLFLGDLGRYREQVNETSNYGKCRQWYIKSHEINPKNGKPYNQLALLAVYARRKLDAVYYYMRSLMSSNPVPSARESLIALFDENRKKYEQGEKKRREERLERAKLHMKQKESEESGTAAGSLRKETWIRPDGGRRVHRTTQAVQDQKDSEEEDLAALTSVEVNKRFVISYLHVHGKLITRIGMESFNEAAMQMLKEFRALLQHSPLPLPCNRFLQLLALNMFAIESTQLKDPQLQSQSGYRSEYQERALVVSLQMFNLILERCVSMLQEHFATNQDHVNSLPQEVHVLLPAIKIWCDWMLCHSSVWNPPPSTQDFKVGAPGDTWSRLAVLMNLLEQMDQAASGSLVSDHREGFDPVRLPEDGVLCGFTPLLYNGQEPATYAPRDLDIELGQFALRLSKLLFFGTVFLCGLEPPVLKLEIEDDFREYVSVVSTSTSRDSPPTPQDLTHNNDVLLESFSGEEDEIAEENVSADAPVEIRDLLTRKVELEKRRRSQELHMQRVKKILNQSVVSVHIEVRPKYLIPDTNCFIDHLERISTIASSHVYTLMVPIVVLSELEGLARGGKSPMPAPRSLLDPQHVLKVAESAKNALDFLKSRHQSVKCITTKGAILTSTTFTTEDDSTLDNNLKNDDKILATCLALCKGSKEQQGGDGAPRNLVREVVLLTEDRNLRVKAYARDVPVRELPDFMQWAGLG